MTPEHRSPRWRVTAAVLLPVLLACLGRETSAATGCAGHGRADCRAGLYDGQQDINEEPFGVLDSRKDTAGTQESGITGDPVNCRLLTPSDTSCATYIAQKAIPNLAFTNPSEWSAQGFRTYIIQDGKYMQYYERVVNFNVHYMCQSVLHPDVFSEVETKLSEFPFNLADYENRYGVVLSSEPDSTVLTDYMNHYKAQKTCTDLLSAMLPCLCIYPPIAKVLQYNVNSSKAHGKPVVDNTMVTTWLIDNASSGSTCSTLQMALASKSPTALRVASYQTSFEFELNFFNQSAI